MTNNRMCGGFSFSFSLWPSSVGGKSDCGSRADAPVPSEEKDSVVGENRTESEGECGLLISRAGHILSRTCAPVPGSPAQVKEGKTVQACGCYDSKHSGSNYFSVSGTLSETSTSDVLKKFIEPRFIAPKHRSEGASTVQPEIDPSVSKLRDEAFVAASLHLVMKAQEARHASRNTCYEATCAGAEFIAGTCLVLVATGCIAVTPYVPPGGAAGWSLLCTAGVFYVSAGARIYRIQQGSGDYAALQEALSGLERGHPLREALQ